MRRAGSAAKWAHSALALAVRVLGRGEAGEDGPDPAAVLAIVERICREGDARRAATRGDLGPEDARAVLGAFLDAVGLDLDAAALLAHLQADGFAHADLARRARHAHERRLTAVVHDVLAAGAAPAGLPAAALRLFEACVPAIPYAPAAAFLGRERSKLTQREDEAPRVALVADGLGGVHGVSRTLAELRERGVPGFDVEVVGTDMNVDRRLGAVAEVDVPLYPGLRVGVPSLPAVVEALADGRYDLVHLCSPGPAGVVAALVARMADLPMLISYHTELAAYAGLRSGDPALGSAVACALTAFHAQADHVLSPSPASDGALLGLGVPPDRVSRWDRGVDCARFDPALRDPALLPGEVTVLASGRLTREKGVELLADAFLAARARDPRLHLVLAGGGPEEADLRARLGPHVTPLGWLAGDALARAYASADVLLFASRTDTFGQVLLEAQASGLPVVAVGQGGPCSIVEDEVSGLLRAADPEALGGAVAALAADPARRAALARAGLAAVRGRTWEASLARLADGYRAALAARGRPAGEARPAA